MDVGDVQDADRGRVRLVGGQRGGDVVELRHVRHQARQLLLVDVELADDAAGVADQRGRRGQQAGVLRLQDRLGVPGGEGGRPGGGQQGEGEAAGGEGPAGPAVDARGRGRSRRRPRRRRSARPGRGCRARRPGPPRPGDRRAAPGGRPGPAHGPGRAGPRPRPGGAGPRWLPSSRAPSGETLIFVPPVKEGRRVMVVSMGPTGDPYVAHDQQPEPGAEEHDATAARGRGRTGAAGRPSSATGCGRRVRQRAGGGARRSGGTGGCSEVAGRLRGRGPLVAYAQASG